MHSASSYAFRISLNWSLGSPRPIFSRARIQKTFHRLASRKKIGHMFYGLSEELIVEILTNLDGCALLQVSTTNHNFLGIYKTHHERFWTIINQCAREDNCYLHSCAFMSESMRKRLQISSEQTAKMRALQLKAMFPRINFVAYTWKIFEDRFRFPVEFRFGTYGEPYGPITGTFSTIMTPTFTLLSTPTLDDVAFSYSS